MYLRVFFFVVVVVNIQIFLFIKLCNLYLLGNTLKKPSGVATGFLDCYDQHCLLYLQLWAFMTPRVCSRTCPRPWFRPQARYICGRVSLDSPAPHIIYRHT